MTAALLAGSAGAQTTAAVRSELEALGLSVTGLGEGWERGLVTRRTPVAMAIVLVADALGPVARRDAYILWQLGIPVAFAIVDTTGGDSAAIAAACERFAARLGHAGATCVALTDGEIAPAVLALAQPARKASPAGAGSTPGADRSADRIRATVAWTADEPLLPGRGYTLRSDTTQRSATVAPIKYRLDLDTLQAVAATQLSAGEIGDCELELDGPLATETGPGGHPTVFALNDRLTGAAVGIGIVRFGLRRADNLRWQATSIDAAARAAALGQSPCVLWLTGLSGAGKSTIADRVEAALHARGRHTYLLDGDNVRHGLNRDLGFTDADRVENIRRVAEVAKLMADAGLIVLVSFISPFASERAMARSMFAPGSFYEVFVDAPLAVAEARDPKGLYAKARRGELVNFTGIDSAYEPPQAPELRIDTDALSPDEAAAAVLDLLVARDSAGADRRGAG